MSLMLEKDRVRWEAERRKGRVFWIADAGFKWGILFFITTNLVEWLLGFDMHISLRTLATAILGGFVVGATVWIGSERKFQKYLRETKAGNELSS